MSSNRYAATTAALSLLLTLGACGGGGGGGTSTNITPPTNNLPPPGESPVTVVGPIAGFGSVYVNGIEFETDAAEYEVDDDAAFDDSALAVGMVIKVEGRVSADGLRGTATRIYYDDDVEGPVQGLTEDPDNADRKLFTVMGVNVVAKRGVTVFDGDDNPGFGFDSIQDGDIVEVSGHPHAGALLARYIEQQSDLDDDFEAKGTVTGYDGADSFTLTVLNGSSLNVTLADGAEIPAAGIADGQYVEVHGSIPDPLNAPADLLAFEVELEDDDAFDSDDDEVEIEGVLGFDGVDAWSIDDTLLAFRDTTEYKPESLRAAIEDGGADGLSAEAEGTYVNNVLVVERLKIDEDDLEIKGTVEMVQATDAKTGVLTLSFGQAEGLLEVIVDGSTMFVDDDSLNKFDLGDLVEQVSFVEIHAHLNDAGEVVAGRLEREDSPEGFEIEGPVTVVDDVSVTLLTVTFGIDGNTFFEDGMPVVGNIAGVEDEDGDGIAESIDIED